MGINKDEARERQPARRSKKQTLSEAVLGRESAPSRGTGYAPAPREGYGDFGEFLASGNFRSMVFKPDASGGGTFTLKGVLEVRASAVGVYMHGTVASVEMLPSVLDDLLWKGCWRRDQYWKEPVP